METVTGNIVLTVIIVGNSFVHSGSKGTEVPLQLIFGSIYFSK